MDRDIDRDIERDVETLREPFRETERQRETDRTSTATLPPDAPTPPHPAPKLLPPTSALTSIYFLTPTFVFPPQSLPSTALSHVGNAARPSPTHSANEAPSPFRAAVGMSIWSSKLPMTFGGALLNHFDAPRGVTLLFTWSGPGLDHCVGTLPVVHRKYMGSMGSQPGPIHLLHKSAAQVGFTQRVPGQQGWLHPGWPPLAHDVCSCAALW